MYTSRKKGEEKQIALITTLNYRHITLKSEIYTVTPRVCREFCMSVSVCLSVCRVTHAQFRRRATHTLVSRLRL